MVGTIVNAAAVAGGSLIGIAAGRRLPASISDDVLSAMGLFTVFLGLKMAAETAAPLLVLISLVVGTVLGTTIDIEGRLDHLGERVKDLIGQAGGLTFTRGFVAASLLFCVGPMAIMGSIQDGIAGDWSILATKSMMDGITAAAFASSLGIGVAFSAGSVLLYQGAITLLAGVMKPLMTEPVVREMTAVGGILVLGIGFNIMLRTKLRVGNMLPAIFVVLAGALLLAH